MEVKNILINLIFWLQVLEPIVELYHLKNIKMLIFQKIIKFFLLMLMTFLMFSKWWKFITQ